MLPDDELTVWQHPNYNTLQWFYKTPRFHRLPLLRNSLEDHAIQRASAVSTRTPINGLYSDHTKTVAMRVMPRHTPISRTIGRVPSSLVRSMPRKPSSMGHKSRDLYQKLRAHRG